MKRRFYSFMLCLVSLVIGTEIMGYVSTYASPEWYAPADYATKLTPQGFHFMLGQNASIITGWTAPKHMVFRTHDCMGRSVSSSFDDIGARTYPGYRMEEAQIVMVGDSYTAGGELGDLQATPARIYARSDIMTANLGVGGFGPVQAFLQATSQIQHFPNARVVTMGIMYENIDRMLSGYRIAYAPNQVYAFQPYIRDGLLHTLNPNVFNSYADYVAASKIAYPNDYWARPRAKFPYSLSLIRALTSRAFSDKWRQQRDMHHFEAFHYAYTDPERGKDLFVLLSMFAHWAHDKNLTPIVMFIPMSASDTKSPDLWIARYASQLPANLIVKNLNTSILDMHHYNLSPLGGCHASAYAADEIAKQYLAVVRQHSLLLRNILYPAPETMVQMPSIGVM